MAQLDHSGGAAPTTLAADITSSTALTFSTVAAINWPSGGVNGKFYVTINRGGVNEERIAVQSRSSTSFTIATVVDRGVDGTAATIHSAGESVEHTFSGIEADDSNDHIYNTGRDDHTQYLNTTRHAAISHTSAMIGTDQVGSAQIAANAVGSSELADNAVDTAAIQNLAVTGGKIANDTITGLQIAPDAIGTSELADNAVDSGAIAAGAVVAGKIAAGGVSATNQITDAIVTRAKVASAAANTYTPTLTGVTIGNGSAFGVYEQLGRFIFLQAGFVLGSTSTVSGTISISLPINYDNSGTYNANLRLVGGAWCQDISTGARFAAAGIIDPSQPDRISRFVNAATTGGFDNNAPFVWANGDMLFVTVAYWTA